MLWSLVPGQAAISRDRRRQSSVKPITKLAAIRWPGSRSWLKGKFNEQLENFRRGFVQPLARSEDPLEAAQSVAATERDWTRPPWDPMDGPALLDFVRPEEAFVRDRVSTVSAALRGLAVAIDRQSSQEICRLLYRQIWLRRFYFELERVIGTSGAQHIRRPNEIATDRCGTCLDLACLFASLLEASHQRAVVIVLGNESFAHALAGYIAPQEVPWEESPSLGDLRRAVHQNEVVLFEPTGAVEANGAIGAEIDQERSDGKKTLDFDTAREAAERMIGSNAVALKHVVDVSKLRRGRVDV